MATLNTLRTKGGVVVAVVIGVSLLAFLLGDFASSGGAFMGASNMNVGVVDSEDISVQEYSESIDQVTLVQQMLSGSEAQTEQVSEAVRSQAWDRLVRKIAFFSSLEKLGLVVSDTEKIDMAAGEYISPVLSSIFVNQQTGLYDREMVKNFTSSLDFDTSGRSVSFWNFIENEMVEERAFAKYFSLIENSMVVTDAEVEMLTNISNVQSNIMYVNKPTYAIADSLVKVTESDLKAYWETHKNIFKTVASRDIEYVMFEALPSEADYAAAQKYIDGLATDFKAAEDLKQFVTLNSSNKFDETFKKSTEFAGELASYVADKKRGEMYGPVKEGDIYTMARVIDSKMLPDTLGAKHILVAATDATLADSLAKVLRKDKSKFAQLATQYSLDQNANQSGGDLGVFAASQMIPEFSNAIAASKVGEIITVPTQFGIHIIQVTKIGPKFPKYQVAVVNYMVNPSNQTEQTAYAKAASFAKDALASNFDKALSEAGLSKRSARLRAGERNVGGIVGSTELVRWAFDNEQGAVSSVISVGQTNYVAKVVLETEHGFAPLDKVRSEVRNGVLKEKKAEYILSQLKGTTTLEEMAKKLDVEVGEAADVNFGLYYIPNLGVAPEVVGAVTAVKEGETSKPIVSAMNVSIVKVTKQTTADNVTAQNQKAMAEANATTSVDQRALAAIYSLADIRDMRIKFF